MTRAMACFAAVALLSACPGKINEPDGGAGGGTGGGAANGGGTGGGTGGGGADIDGGYTKSAKGNVRFKGDLRLTIDLAVALSLPLDQLCNELGMYACLGVHTVALMGVDPYGKGLFEPLPVTGATTPVVTERMVMASCLRRVDLDLQTPAAAVIFKGLGVTGGKLTNLESTEVRLAITELSQRAWLRDPTDGEVAIFKKLYTDIDATGAAEPAKTWMQSACFTAFTTAESVFY